MLTRIPKLTMGKNPTRYEYNSLVDRLNLLSNITAADDIYIEKSQAGVMIRSRAAASSDITRIYARVTRTLKRAVFPIPAGTSDEDIEKYYAAREVYLITFLTADPIASWSAGVNYVIDDFVKYESEYYKCKMAHLSTDDNFSKPDYAGSSLWEEMDGVEAYVMGFDGTLTQTIPWFQVDEIVQVVSRPVSYSAEGVPSEERRWYIMETVTPTEYVVGDNRAYSLMWYQGSGGVGSRAMAVFK